MRVLHVVPTYIPAYRYGGPIYSVHGLCAALVKMGHDIHVFTTNVDGEKDSDVPLQTPVEIDGVKVWYFPSKFLRRMYWSPSLGHALKKEVSQFEVLHLHSIFLWPTWAAARIAKARGIPYIVAPRGMLVKELIQMKSFWKKSIWMLFVERRNLEQAAGLHFTSEVEEEEARRFGFRLARSFVVPNGVDLETIGTAGLESRSFGDEIPIDKPLICFLGRINWKKGLDRLIAAMAYVPDCYLLIAGNDEEDLTPRLNSLAVKHGVSERVFFTGPAYGNEKDALLKRAAVVVLPSISENFGNVILEAMARGRPVLVTPEVGLSHLVEETGAGVVVPNKPEVIGSSLARMLASPGELEAMGDRGRRLVENQFSWKSIAARMVDVYETASKG